MTLIIKRRDDADELERLEGENVQQEIDALTYVEFRLGYYDNDDDNGYEVDTRADDEEADEETDEETDELYTGCVDISMDEVLGPGAQAAYDRRRELEDAGLVKKDTRRPGERCD